MLVEIIKKLSKKDLQVTFLKKIEFFAYYETVQIKFEFLSNLGLVIAELNKKYESKEDKSDLVPLIEIFLQLEFFMKGFSAKQKVFIIKKNYQQLENVIERPNKKIE